MIVGALASLAVATVMSGCSGDTTSFTQEAPLEPETPSNGTAIVASAFKPSDEAPSAVSNWTRSTERLLLISAPF